MGSRRVNWRHRLRFGWHSRFRPNKSHVTWSFTPSVIHRLIVRGAWNHDAGRWFCIEWGDGSEPVWSIGYQWADPPPEPLTDDEWDAYSEAVR